MTKLAWTITSTWYAQNKLEPWLINISLHSEVPYFTFLSALKPEAGLVENINTIDSTVPL